MPVGTPKPTLPTFLNTARWAVSNFMLSKIGSAKHDLRFVLLPDRPFLIPEKSDAFDPFNGTNFIHRSIDFSRIGLVCISGTSPSIREIVLEVSIADASPLCFGTNTTLRTGFHEKDVYGTGKQYVCRVDFTKVHEGDTTEAELKTLPPGRVVYPFSGAAGGCQASCRGRVLN